MVQVSARRFPFANRQPFPIEIVCYADCMANGMAILTLKKIFKKRLFALLITPIAQLIMARLDRGL